MIVRFLHHHAFTDTLIHLQQELYKKGFTDMQFGFTENWDKVIMYDIKLEYNKKFLALFEKYGIVIL